MLHAGRNAHLNSAFLGLRAGAATNDAGPAANNGTAAASLAWDALCEIDAPGDPAEHILDGELDIRFQVFAIGRKTGRAPATASTPEEGVKNIAEITAELSGCATVPALRTGLLPGLLIGFGLLPVLAVLIVFFSLVRDPTAPRALRSVP